MLVIEVVSMREMGCPRTRGVEIGKAVCRKLRPVLCGTEQRFREGIVVAHARPRVGRLHAQPVRHRQHRCRHAEPAWRRRWRCPPQMPFVSPDARHGRHRPRHAPPSQRSCGCTSRESGTSRTSVLPLWRANTSCPGTRLGAVPLPCAWSAGASCVALWRGHGAPPVAAGQWGLG